MNPENLPTPNNEQYDPKLDEQDEEVAAGGNNRLLYILVAAVLVLVLGYVALPKGNGSGQSSATPSFMLDDAAVTATAPTAADSIAAGLKAAPAMAKASDEKESKTEKTTVKIASVARTASLRAVAAPSTAVAMPAPAPAAAAEPVAAPVPVAVVAQAAPTNATMAGKIKDENGRPLIGATVMLKGSNKGTSTDANGNYTLEVPSGNDNTLIYGYGGYEDEVVRNHSAQPLDVTLTPREKTNKRRR